MSFMDPRYAYLISLYTLLIDMKCRKDLNQEEIVSERDYVTRFLTHLRYPNGPFKPKSDYIFLRASTNDGSTELNTGTDGIIVFTYEDKYKIGLFEAKWPRILEGPVFSRIKNRWDNLYPLKKGSLPTHLKYKKYSRFTDELIRQKKWSEFAAIWEMFFYEGQLGTGHKTSPFLNPFGSTCIWFDEAFHHFNGYKGLFEWNIWNNVDLEKLFLGIQSWEIIGNRDFGMNIFHIIMDILTCNKGKPLDQTYIQGNSIVIKDNNGENIKIPLFNQNNSNVDAGNNNNQNDEIDNFIRKEKFSYYIFVDLNKCLRRVMNFENGEMVR
jgi:hypothetical protein